LVYKLSPARVTGGLAWSNDQFVRTQLTGTLNLATAGADEAVNKGLLGRTGGGGVAYAFAQNWNLFAQYRYTKFGTSNVSLPLSQLTTTSTINVSTLQIGVNYKFTSGASGALCSRASTHRNGHAHRLRAPEK
jgi:opacity protein-like surface antigen